MKKITVNNNIINWEENMTITRILQIMNYTYRMLVVKVDGKLIKKNEYESTIVSPDVDVKVIHLISGG
ncbi:MAG: thiamine biosynthesis protein ThiS [Candidatus Cloacimonadota bacterium]|nr:MAG: thiamine biosynthesis protein ThiS [Candidatus Cloacimonadota bacterium]